MHPCKFVATLSMVGAASACGGENPSAPPSDVRRPVESHELWVADRGADRILAFSLTGALSRVVLDEGQLDRPSSVRRGPDGMLYVASFGDAAVVRFDAAGNKESFYDDSLLEEPVELLFHDGDLFVLGNDTRNALHLDLQGNLIHEVHPIAKDAHDIAFGPQGHLYVAASDRGNGVGTVQVWDPTRREITRDFAPSHEVSNAMSIAFDAEGHLLVADYTESRILRYGPETGELLAVVSPVGLSKPLCIDFGPDGQLYVVHDEGVSRLDPELPAPELTTVVHTDDHFERPRSLTFVPIPR